jgi:hypothetical protein
MRRLAAKLLPLALPAWRRHGPILPLDRRPGAPRMRRLAFIALLLLAAPAAAAEDWGPPTAEYSALLTFVDGRGETLVHRIDYTRERQRLSYKVGEREEIVIVDRVAGAVFVVFPGLKRYRKAPMVEPEFDLGIGRGDTKRERVADEPVAGVAAVKYRVEAKTAQGQQFNGFAWLSRERILVRFEGEVRQGRRTRRLTMTASELRIGPIDAAVFRVPPDYAQIEDKQR